MKYALRLAAVAAVIVLIGACTSSTPERRQMSGGMGCAMMGERSAGDAGKRHQMMAQTKAMGCAMMQGGTLDSGMMGGGMKGASKPAVPSAGATSPADDDHSAHHPNQAKQ